MSHHKKTNIFILIEFSTVIFKRNVFRLLCKLNLQSKFWLDIKAELFKFIYAAMTSKYPHFVLSDIYFDLCRNFYNSFLQH